MSWSLWHEDVLQKGNYSATRIEYRERKHICAFSPKPWLLGDRPFFCGFDEALQKNARESSVNTWGDFDTVYIEMVFWRICLNHWKFQLEIVDVSWCFALTPALQGALKTCTCGHWEGPKGGTREQFFLVLCTDLWQVYCFQRLI